MRKQQRQHKNQMQFSASDAENETIEQHRQQKDSDIQKTTTDYK